MKDQLDGYTNIMLLILQVLFIIINITFKYKYYFIDSIILLIDQFELYRLQENEWMDKFLKGLITILDYLSIIRNDQSFKVSKLYLFARLDHY